MKPEQNMSDTQTPIQRRQKLTDVFRGLKMGQEIKIEASHYETAHSTARLVGIKVETEVLGHLKPKGFLMKVTRIPNRAKKKAS